MGELFIKCDSACNFPFFYFWILFCINAETVAAIHLFTRGISGFCSLNTGSFVRFSHIIINMKNYYSMAENPVKQFLPPHHPHHSHGTRRGRSGTQPHRKEKDRGFANHLSWPSADIQGPTKPWCKADFAMSTICALRYLSSNWPRNEFVCRKINRMFSFCTTVAKFLCKTMWMFLVKLIENFPYFMNEYKLGATWFAFHKLMLLFVQFMSYRDV